MSDYKECERCGQVRHYPYQGGWLIIFDEYDQQTRDMCGHCAIAFRAFMQERPKSAEQESHEAVVGAIKASK